MLELWFKVTYSTDFKDFQNAGEGTRANKVLGNFGLRCGKPNGKEPRAPHRIFKRDQNPVQPHYEVLLFVHRLCGK